MSDQDLEPQLIAPGEAAVRLGVSPAMVRRYGDAPSCISRGRHKPTRHISADRIARVLLPAAVRRAEIDCDSQTRTGPADVLPPIVAARGCTRHESEAARTLLRSVIPRSRSLRL